MRWNPLAIWTAFLLAYASLEAIAEQPGSAPAKAAPAWTLEEMSQAIAAAKEQFTPLTEEEMERRRSRLTTALDALDKFLAQDRAREADWKRFLEWDALRREAAKPEGANIDALRTSLERLNRPETGLELPAFSELRVALREYFYGLLVGANPNAEAAYRQALDELDKRLAAYLEAPTTDNARQIGEVLGFLEEMSQAPEIVAAVRAHFQQPNLRVIVSGELLAAAVNRPVDEPTEVRETIMGTSVRGYGRTRGQVQVSLTPNDEQAELTLNLSAQAVTQNVGVNGPVTMYSTGTTQIEAVHTLFINDLGVFAGDVFAQACVNTHIYCIAAKHRIVEHIAWRQARQQQPQGEAIASGRATARAREQFSRQVQGQVAEANRNFQERVRGPLLRRQAMPESLRFSTTADQLLATARHATARQLASPTPLPEDVGGDVSVRVHESIIGNFSESAVAGKTYTAEDFAEAAKDFPRGEAEGPKVDESDRDWSVTFRSQTPVTAEFRDGRATLHIFFDQFTSDGEPFTYPIEIMAVYQIEADENGPKLVRQDRVEVNWPDRRPPFGRRTVLESKFRLRFEDMLFRDALFVKDVAPPDAPAGFGVLRDFDLRSQDGWFTAGMRRIPAN
jgi:hypothetical protein